MNKILVLILAPAVILTIVGRLDASEPPAGTQVDCWSLVGTSWKGEAKQGADEIELLISFRRIDLKSGTALGVLLEFPTASEDKQRQLKAFFGKHQQFSKSWHKADKAKPYQYALTIVKSEFIPGIPVNCMVIGSRGRFGLQQLCPYVSWSAYGRAQIERSGNKLCITLGKWRGYESPYLPPKSREMADAVHRDITMHLVPQTEQADDSERE